MATMHQLGLQAMQQHEKAWKVRSPSARYVLPFFFLARAPDKSELIGLPFLIIESTCSLPLVHAATLQVVCSTLMHAL